jgi:phage/plasmid-associated DNA primase
MQEPSKNDSINEGIVKELTGGDPIQCRALFKDSVTFIPQFKLVVCTNCMFDVKSNDDGTWRRLRKVDFLSKFTDKPYKDPKFPVEDYKYQFKIDQKLDDF